MPDSATEMAEKNVEVGRKTPIAVGELDEDLLNWAAEGARPLIVSPGGRSYVIHVQEAAEEELASAAGGVRVGVGGFARKTRPREAEEIDEGPDVYVQKTRAHKPARVHELEGAAGGVRVGVGGFARKTRPRAAEEIDEGPDVYIQRTRAHKPARVHELEDATGGVRVGVGGFARKTRPREAEEIDESPDVYFERTRAHKPARAHELEGATGGVRVGVGGFARKTRPRGAEEIEPGPGITFERTRAHTPIRVLPDGDLELAAGGGRVTISPTRDAYYIRFEEKDGDDYDIWWKTTRSHEPHRYSEY